MIVLHAALLGDELLWWGETTVPPELHAATQDERHPFAVETAALRAAFHGIGVTAAEEREAVAWLPTTCVPLPSTPLLGEPPRSDAPPHIAHTRIAGLTLTPAAERDLLLACHGARTLAPGLPGGTHLIVGPEPPVWAATVLLAGSIVARQRLLPGLRRLGSGWRAAWEPVPAAEDAPAIAALAAALPPAARALGADEHLPPSVTARAAIEAVLARHADALARAERPAPPRPLAFDSVHDQWAWALREPHGDAASPPPGVMRAPIAELEALDDGIRAWRAPLALDEAAPWRLALRLEEPSENAHGWTLRPLVHPTDDPSLLVPTDALFTRTEQAEALTRAVARRGGDPRAYALSALARAAAIAPLLAAALEAMPPRPIALDDATAHAFLTETALLLEAAGFVVLLPSWFTNTGAARRLTVRAQAAAPTMTASGGLHLGAVVQVDWQLALGDDPLTPEELEQLAAIKAPLVRMRGQWVVVDPDRVRDALDRWRRKEHDQVTVRELAQAALGASTEGGLPVASVQADGWLGELLDRLTGRAPPHAIPPPPGFTGALRPYQARGLAWLAFLSDLGFGACLADDMGLGKTVQTLALVQRARAKDPRPVLLVCPTSLLANWQKEADRFTPDLPVLLHHGPARARSGALRQAASRHGLVLTSYGLVLRDLEDLRCVDWAGIVLDEAQNVKNAATRQARAARALPASWRVALTGTPVENHVGELWSILDFLNPGMFGSAAGFQRTFFTPIQAGDRDAAARLKRLTGPFVLRRLKTDPAVAPDLPEKIETTVTCTLTREQATLYEAVLTDARAALAEAEGIKRKGVVLSTITRLKQVCNHPAQLLGDASSTAGRSGKLERATEILDEIVACGDAALVFTQYAEMGRLLTRHLQETLGLEVPFLHGGVPRVQRDAMVERFQTPGGPPILLLSLKAGGTGLNLTRATHVLHYDRWWNPAVESQASDRAYRIGQRRTVEVHTLVCAGTFEERIDALLRRKARLAAQVVGVGEAWLTELSDDELNDVLALRATALEDEDDR